MHLIEFLLARIAEDEESADYAPQRGAWNRDRILPECGGKRRIVDFLASAAGHEFGGAMQLSSLELNYECDMILQCTRAYSRHPEFDSMWS